MERWESCVRGFRLNRLLGEGQYGKVYEACSDTCDYAVKVSRLDPDEYDDAKEYREILDRNVRLFKKEADITKAMSELGITPKLYSYRFCPVGDGVFGIMIVEKYDADLEKYIEAKSGRLTRTETLQIKELVRRMHDAGIAHLDLKEPNVMVKMVNDAPHFAIIDFGNFASVVGEDEPLKNYGKRTMTEYYREMYGDLCYTQRHVEDLRENKGKRTWDPRSIDIAFLCSLDRYI